MGQGGNVYEWQETDSDLVNGPTISSSDRGVRGGSWSSDSDVLSSSFRDSLLPINVVNSLGFRVASTPEPSTLLLAALASLGLLWRRR